MTHSPTVAPGHTLSSAQRATLATVVQTVLPHAFEQATQEWDPVALVERRLAAAPAPVAADLLRALDVLESRAGGLLIAGRAARFSALSPAARERVFAAWGDSSLATARAVHQALRRFVVSTWYGTPPGRADAGARPPLHARPIERPWEGPLPGTTRDDEPVARVAAPEAWHAPPPAPRPVPAAVTLGDAVRGTTSLTADVVIVGSGAGGAVAAARLAEAGREVLIVEAGPYLDAPDFTEDEGPLVPRLYADQALRATVDGSVMLLQGGAVGGGSLVNWMLMLRPPDDVLESWVRDHGLVDTGPDAMAPVLDRIEAEVHASLVPDDAHGPTNRVILDGARALGWRVSSARINAAGCVRAGTCGLGCRYEAKQSVLLTYLPRAFAAGARLFANAQVERIEILERNTGAGEGTPPRKRVHATVRHPDTGATTGTLAIDAPVVVLAGGAVGTPAILQRSGLGGGGVGRYLRLHPTSGVMGVYGREMYPLTGIPQSAYCDEFLRRDDNGHGFWIEAPALQPALAAAAMGGFGAPHRTDMQRLANTAGLIVLVRDGSGETGSQGSVWLDRTGTVRVRYRMSAADRANLRAGLEAAARLHLAAGAHEVATVHTRPVRVRSDADLPAIRRARYGPNHLALFSAHVNGTCRMGVHPATSGTTPEGERHGVRGLYACDGSLLPTSLGVNPQETIMALASLVAERIAR